MTTPISATLAAPDDFRLYLERFDEPYSGIPLWGVGGEWAAPPGAADAVAVVRLDGGVRASVPMSPSPHGLAFGTQMPVEAGVQSITVQVRVGETVHDAGTFGTATVPSREAAPPPPRPDWRRPRQAVRRLLGYARSLPRRLFYRLQSRAHRHEEPHAGFVRHTAHTAAELEAMRERAACFQYRPKISILMPVYNVDPRWLGGAIDSVLAQTYDNWELCLADDASTRPDLVAYLQRLPRDGRILLSRRAKNGHICAATNTAAALATGTFVALMDNDDLLAPHALYEVAALLQRHPEADVVYSDEDKVTPEGRRYDPQFKPDWSPELLRSYNYVNHFTVIRRAAFERAGRFRLGYEGSQDHDLLLRVTEATERVFHIPQILYHWRAVPESTAAGAGVKPYVHLSGRKAVDDHLHRTRTDAGLRRPPVAERLDLPILRLEWPDAGRDVAVCVLAPDSVEALRDGVEALRANTAHRNWRLRVSIDGPADDSRRAYLAEVARRDPRVVPVPDAGGCRAGRLNRLAAGAGAEFLLFLDAGCRPGSADWLTQLTGHAALPGVGFVGAAEVAADGTRHHCGLVLGMRDGIAPAYAFHGLPAGAVSYYFQAEVTRNVSAVPASSMVVARHLFESAGGFDERFGDGLFDVELCLRLAGRGLRGVCVGGVALTRADIPAADAANDRADAPTELVALLNRHGRRGDPFYNPNLCARHSFRTAADGPLPALVRDTPRRALYVTHNLANAEGAPRYLFEIAAGLHARGTVAAELYSPTDGKGRAGYDAMGVPVRVDPSPYSARFIDAQWDRPGYEAFQRRAAQTLAEARPDVVVANTLLSFPMVDAACRAGIPSVWVIHESYAPAQMALLMSPFARARCETAFRLASRVIPASHDTAALFAHLDGRGNAVVLHNGLPAGPFDDAAARWPRADAEAAIGATPGTLNVIAVGTVCERKGQHALVEAAAILRRERPALDFRIYLVGARPGIPYADAIRHRVAAQGLEGCVELVAETDAVAAYFRAADVFVCTSHMETFSRAILEAEAFGLPIVSTACQGVPEQVFWGHNALRFDRHDAAGLARQLAAVLSDDALRARMARESRAAFDCHLDYDEMLDRYDAAIRGAARHAPGAGVRTAPAVWATEKTEGKAA